MLVMATGCLLASSSVEGQLYVGPEHYAAPAFTKQSLQASYLYFVGDSPQLQVTVVNRSTQPVVLDLPPGTAAFVGRLRGLDTRGMPTGPSEEVRLDTISGPVLHVVRGARMDLTGTSGVLDIQPDERVEWKFSVTFDRPMSPGFYAIELSWNGRCADGCRIVDIAHIFSFEWRQPRSLEDRLERFYRGALYSLWANRLDEADANIRDLLALYPDSVDALAVRGKIAERRGDVAAAISAYEAALSLLNQGRDTILLARAVVDTGPEEAAWGLRGDIERLKRARSRFH